MRLQLLLELSVCVRSMCGAEPIAATFVNSAIDPALMAYKLNVGDYPSTKEGLNALREAPKGKEDLWKGPYVKSEVIDPWGNPYQYRYPSIHDNEKYDIYSLGIDGVESADDLTNWKPYDRDIYTYSSGSDIPMFVTIAILLLSLIYISVVTRRFLRSSKAKSTSPIGTEA